MKKVVLLVGSILAISAYFVATQPITPRLAVVSSISVLFFALPSYLAILKLEGKKRAAVLIALLGLYALVIESLAIKTGVPYGHFVYKDVLGNKLFGLTPWTVAFAYPPIILLTYWFARVRHAKTSTFKILFSTAFDAVLIDLVLDPAAVRLGFWYWPSGGIFYNVPLINFAGWLVTAFLGAGLLHAFLKDKTVPASLSYSGLAILWFWAFVNLYLAQTVPAIVGFSMCALFFSKLRGKPAILRA